MKELLILMLLLFSVSCDQKEEELPIDDVTDSYPF